MSQVYLLSNQKYENTKSLSVIEVSFLKEEVSIRNYNAIIFTSKNSVKALNKITPNWKNIPTFSLSKPTANEIKAQGGEIEYIGKNNFTGNKFAKAIIPLLKGKKVLYPRAKIISSNLPTILRNKNIEVDEIIVYETKCIPCENLIKPPPESILIFSSPSCVKCFFSCFQWNDSWKAICIGKITQKAFPSNILTILPEKHDILSCIDLAVSI